ncbi:hypothetical protein GCM10023342_04030 [Modicisalibacter zincidurans]|uniref:Uncharacterized protein n=1 Tax=Modicisalibacter zincidurans TaxID=1178777 RepID=A0ABP9R1Z7_9GAMM
MSRALVAPVKVRRQVTQVNPGRSFKENAETRDEQTTVWKSLMPRFQEKPLSVRSRETVPQTDTGGQGENPKALERTRVKELGKMVP